MDEPVLADIDAGMADAAPTVGGEEHQIAGLQRVTTHVRPAQIAHFLSGTRKIDTGCTTVDVADQPAAVEAAVRRVATPAIGRTDQPECAEQHILGDTGHGVGSARRLGDWRRRRLAGTGSQQGEKNHEGGTGQIAHGRAV